MKALYILYILLLLGVLVSCKKANNENGKCDLKQAIANNEAKVTISSGMWGTVILKDGNCFPTDVVQNSTCSACPTQREIKIYEYTRLGDATHIVASSLYENVKTKLVKSVMADVNGFYQTELPAGKYSVFIVESGKLYANWGDNDGIAPVTVTQGVTQYNPELNYAVY